MYSIYKTTNLINGRIYVGVHCETKYPELDDYLGSGTILKRAVKKYGQENFTRKVLHYFETAEEAYLWEEYLVGVYFVERSDVYNMNIGGSCPPDWTGKKRSEETRRRQGLAKKGWVPTKETRDLWSTIRKGKKPSAASIAKSVISRTGLKRSTKARHNMSIAQKKVKHDPRSEETKSRISETMSGMVQPKMICPHCGKGGAGNCMKRWHFDKCKSIGK